MTIHTAHHRNGGTALLALLSLLLVLGSLGCNWFESESAKQRHLLEPAIAMKQKEVSDLQSRLQEAESDLTSIQAKIADLRKERGQVEQRKNEVKDALASYILDNKLATAALVGMGGGAAATVADNVDQDVKATLQGLGLVAAGYYLFNAEECNRVAGQLAYYGSQISDCDKGFEALDAQLSEQQQAVASREESLRNLRQAHSAQQEELEALQGRYNSL
jgi:peptidoglycan hydrolase CwlO-like protein